MTNEEQLKLILSSNVSKEQKDVLLDLFSKKLIEERNAKNEKSKYTTTKEEREKKIEEINRKHALKEESKKFEQDILYMRDVLSWVRNGQGERIYKDIKCDTQAEIKEVCDLYEMFLEKWPEAFNKAIEEYNRSKEEVVIANAEPVKEEVQDIEVVQENIEPVVFAEPVVEENNESYFEEEIIEENEEIIEEGNVSQVSMLEKLKKLPDILTPRFLNKCQQPEKNGLLRRAVRSIKNKFTEWKNQSVTPDFTEKEIYEVAGINDEPTSVVKDLEEVDVPVATPIARGYMNLNNIDEPLQNARRANSL